jgi:hypothetical protein
VPLHTCSSSQAPGTRSSRFFIVLLLLILLSLPGGGLSCGAKRARDTGG